MHNFWIIRTSNFYFSKNCPKFDFKTLKFLDSLDSFNKILLKFSSEILIQSGCNSESFYGISRSSLIFFLLRRDAKNETKISKIENQFTLVHKSTHSYFGNTYNNQKI